MSAAVLSFDARTEPEHPRLAKIWKLLVCRLDAFEMRVASESITAVVKGEAFPISSEPTEASGFIRTKWGGNVRRAALRGDATLVKMGDDWMTTEQVGAALGVTARSALDRLSVLYGNKHVERRKVGRTVEWRKTRQDKRDRRGYNGYVFVEGETFDKFREHCETEGVSMRATLDRAIAAELDRLGVPR